MSGGWRRGNRVTLLENGEQYFPRVFAAIAAAEHEVHVETFILREDAIGLELGRCLAAAARRGVDVFLTVDGYGTPGLPIDLLAALETEGVHCLVFDPRPNRLLRRFHGFRRLHRKLAVIDRRVAYVGGINFEADQLANHEPAGKHDFAVEVAGPIVDDVLAVVRRPHRTSRPPLPPPGPQGRWRWWRRLRRAARPASERAVPPAGDAEVMLVTRDNRRHQGDIERHYRLALRAARREVIIANAYFFPGYRLLRQLRRAARRGVRVRLVVQGTAADMAIVPVLARSLYPYLVPAGVEVYEQNTRPLHGKVAAVDDRWATVGSSNLDPLSLAFNLEANVMIRDREFAATLRRRLEAMIEHDCTRVSLEQVPPPRWWGALGLQILFHVLRRFPTWAGWLPPHRPRITPASEAATEARR